MTLTLSLAILLLSDINHLPRRVEASVGHVELNHVMRDAKNAATDQLIFWNYRRGEAVADDYLRVGGFFELGQSPLYLFLGGDLYVLHFRSSQETVTPFDPEYLNRQHTPLSRRRPIFHSGRVPVRLVP